MRLERHIIQVDVLRYSHCIEEARHERALSEEHINKLLGKYLVEELPPYRSVQTIVLQCSQLHFVEMRHPLIITKKKPGTSGAGSRLGIATGCPEG